MDFLKISSLQNPKIKLARSLQGRKQRRETGLVPVEGYAELELALSASFEPRTVFVCPERFRAGEAAILRTLQIRGAEIFELPPAIMDKISYREHPDGWLCLGSVPGFDFSTFKQSLSQRPNPLIVLAEDLEKPGNLGALFRTAEAAGVHGIVSVDGRTDLTNPNVIRASKGTVFSLPAAEASAEELSEWLGSRAVRVVAADPVARLDYWAADFTGPTAFVLGAEKEGLSEFWRSRAELLVRVPMSGKINSLNVASTGALLVYEALRQRGAQR